jgi:hypothetical protein
LFVFSTQKKCISVNPKSVRKPTDLDRPIALHQLKEGDRDIRGRWVEQLTSFWGMHRANHKPGKQPSVKKLGDISDWDERVFSTWGRLSN